MAKARYMMVRVRYETHARLRAECERLAASMEAGFTADRRTASDNSNPACLDLTYDALISHLIRQRQRHRERRRQSHAKRRKPPVT